MSAQRPAPEALALGVDTEEIYLVFGEGLQVAGPGLPPAHHDLVAAKARRTVGTLLRLGVPVEVVQAFEQVTTRIHRAGEPLPGGLDPGGFAARNAEDERALNSIMGAIRNKLREQDAVLYDAGIMLSRLRLCVRMVMTAAGQRSATALRYLDAYRRELDRVVPITHQILGALGANTDARRELDARLDEALGRVHALLGAWDGGSAAWCDEARERLDRVFELAGALLRGPELRPAEVSEHEHGSVLEERRRLLEQRLLAGEGAGAEPELRALLVICQQALGPGDPVSLKTKADLSLAMLLLARGDEAAALAYDLAEESELHLGRYHPVTARLQVHAMFVLMSTREFQEIYDFQTAKLEWLARADPTDLDPAYREAQDELFGMIGRPGARE